MFHCDTHRVFPAQSEIRACSFVKISRGVLPCEIDGGARRKFSKTPLKVPESHFMDVASNLITPLRGTNSETIN